MYSRSSCATNLIKFITYSGLPVNLFRSSGFCVAIPTGKHILPVGWNNWGKKENEETVFYAEYRNTGEGAATASRASFGKQLNDISNYNEAQILAGDDGWNPVENGNVLLQNLKR